MVFVAAGALIAHVWITQNVSQLWRDTAEPAILSCDLGREWQQDDEARVPTYQSDWESDDVAARCYSHGLADGVDALACEVIEAINNETPPSGVSYELLQREPGGTFAITGEELTLHTRWNIAVRPDHSLCDRESTDSTVCPICELSWRAPKRTS